ncbi:PREDICTED: annexin A1-like [Cyprinodon variegatus]|uniref:annexin A1-like n=1 Tax=Cyprinodon variegatus TaxID=28743 RepID=UPI000742C19B|nr:PREDICTED: annexin A1-like [Cyprinodon variegatus]
MSIFKKFFKDIVHDRDPKKESVKEKEKPKYYGTVIPYPNFNASSDASVLQSGIESKGVDEDVIIAILVKRSNEQRQKIKAVYEASSGKNLVKSLKSVLKSDLEDVALALLMPPAHFDAYLLRKATKSSEYKQDLEEVIKDETKGDFMNALLALLSAKRDESTEVDMELARKDAKILFEAAETKGDIDVSTFIDILTTRNGPQLSKTFHHYAAVSDLKLPRALQMNLSGDIEDCLIAIVKCAWNTPAFFAEKLHNAMKGHGTCEDTLMRILVSRSEIDLQKIVEEYRAMYENTVHEDILNDTKGHYQKILLGLCGPY